MQPSKRRIEPKHPIPELVWLQERRQQQQQEQLRVVATDQRSPRRSRGDSSKAHQSRERAEGKNGKGHT
jgi:hypothetical protein